MGWLQGSKKSKGRRTKKKPRSGPRWDPAKALLAAKVLGVIAALVLVVLGWNRSEAVLGRYASQTRAQEVYPDSVELVDAPQWMDELLSERLREMVAFDVGADPLDGTGLKRAAERLGDDPWVASVDQVRRAPDGLVRVTASYRRPAALVAGKRGYHLVDRQVVWLEGPVDRAATRWSGLPLITGVASPPPAAPGRRWSGSDIGGGADARGAAAAGALRPADHRVRREPPRPDGPPVAGAVHARPGDCLGPAPGRGEVD